MIIDINEYIKSKKKEKNIDKENNQEVKNNIIEHLSYKKEEYKLLNDKYGLKEVFSKRDTRPDGCILKKEFENACQKNLQILSSALIDTVFIYLEKTNISAYYDAYQENVGIGDNESLVSQTLIYNQIQKLIFKNSNSYSYKRIPPLYNYFLNDNISVILKILDNYFISVYEVFGLIFLYSSDAFRLMVEIFPDLYDIGVSKKDLRVELFKEEFNNISQIIGYSELRFLNEKESVLDSIYNAVKRS